MVQDSSVQHHITEVQPLGCKVKVYDYNALYFVKLRFSNHFCLSATDCSAREEEESLLFRAKTNLLFVNNSTKMSLFIKSLVS
jgi:hypothetical protein